MPGERKPWRIWIWVGVFGSVLMIPLFDLQAAVKMNGFDLTHRNIPLGEIQSGGPGKNGIPALLKPQFIPAKEVSFLKEEDRVLVLTNAREAKVYPIRILNWHEVVNDIFMGKPVIITYCPLCGTGMAFDSIVNNQPLTFGVSGLLYHSDVLMYDHQTESLWSQIKQEAVTGRMMGSRLILLPLLHTTWGEWRKEHRDSLVLSTDTGFVRDYGRDPYQSYSLSSRLMFPVGDLDSRFDPKTWVLGVDFNGSTKAYPFLELEKGPGSFKDQVGGQELVISFDPNSRTARVRDSKGKELPGVVAYWFAWFSFHPETDVYFSVSLDFSPSEEKEK